MDKDSLDKRKDVQPETQIAPLPGAMDEQEVQALQRMRALAATAGGIQGGLKHGG